MNHFTLFKTLISAGNIVIDVGGHKGHYAQHFSNIVGSNGAVYSFEPHPDLYPQLENVAIQCPRSNIFPFSYAVSTAIGQETLFAGSEELHDQASTICIEHANADRLGSSIRKFSVRTIPLDFFCEELKIGPDFVKIDVEGAENRVILGMQNTLTRHKPTVFFEFGQADSRLPTPQHFQDLRNLGYTLYLADITKFLGKPPFSWQHILDSSNDDLKDKIFSFTDEDLLSSVPFHTNILAIHATSAIQALSSQHIQPFTEAQHLLTNPKLYQASCLADGQAASGF